MTRGSAEGLGLGEELTGLTAVACVYACGLLFVCLAFREAFRLRSCVVGEILRVGVGGLG